jgi:hypothetical protein
MVVTVECGPNRDVTVFSESVFHPHKPSSLKPQRPAWQDPVEAMRRERQPPTARFASCCRAFAAGLTHGSFCQIASLLCGAAMGAFPTIERLWLSRNHCRNLPQFFIPRLRSNIPD